MSDTAVAVKKRRSDKVVVPARVLSEEELKIELKIYYGQWTKADADGGR
jgi:hypothetical protein